MSDVTDAQLLREYSQRGSHAAFAELVRRHVHLVHASALRQSRGDAHLADDVTQAVFMVLARRAGSIGDAASITGWLINTTRYAALSAHKIESRRRCHERRATAMARARIDDEANVHDALCSTLDAALARLRARDRSVIALRYLQGKGIREVGEALGISQHAAQKRVGRALERLRDILARHGVTTPADALAGNLSSLSLHVAPTTLVSSVIATGGAAAPAAASASVIAGATSKTIALAKAKLFATAAAACMVVGGVAAPIVTSARSPSSPATATATATAAPAPNPVVAPAPATPIATTQAAPLGPPVKFPNATFFLNNNNKQEFTAGVDAQTIRVPGGEPATILTSDTPRWGSGGVALRAIDPSPFRGKRIRFWAYVKCNALANWGSLILVVWGRDGRVLANDDMGGRPITRTTDWTRLEIVADVPQETESIHCGLNLRGKGELWMDSAQIEVVPKTVPITDDQIWHPWSFSSPHYSTKLDPTTPRNGKPTRLLQSTVASPGEWYAWDWNNRHPDKWLGKRMKLSMWIKTENVTGPSGLCLRVVGPSYADVIPGLSKDQRTIRGTTPWTRYEFIAHIPPETQNICTGVRLGGKGKLWVDEVRYELLE